MSIAPPCLRRWPHAARLAAAVAGLVLAAGLAGAAPPTPDAPHATANAGLAAPGNRVDLARVAALTEPALLAALADGQRRDFFIAMNERADLSAAFGMSWRERGRYVFKTLRDTADRSQAKLRAALTAQGAQIRPFWIANGILVRDGNLEQLTRAAGFADVRRIITLPHAAFEQPPVEPAGTAAEAGIVDNLRQIGADRVWDQGTTGNGVTVGIIDSGVLHTHEALRRQYRGNRGTGLDNHYNWLDPEVHTDAPRWTSEHGTHVAGTIVGDNGNADPARRERIGVAPGAQWMGCLALGTDADLPRFMVECFEFMLAPTRTDGTLPDPDRRPDIVNNSWVVGGTCNGEGVSVHQEAIEAWVAAGVLPVFAAGNTSNCDLPQPPGLSTVAAPGSLAASFAVGSTGNHNGQYATHSLWGPTAATGVGAPGLPDVRGYPQLKPQVVAPGVSIRSAFGEATPYAKMTGTSMSAPHVAGVFALMIEAGECLRGDYARLGTILMQTARAVPYDSGGSPAPGPGNVPNYATGWGEIDAPAAVNAAANACGPQGFIRGRVTGPDGRPVADATIEIADAAGLPVHTLKTDVDGGYVRRLPQLTAGGYTVRVSAYGFLPDAESGLLVGNGADTSHNVILANASFHKITGRVTDAATGWPLHARIAIAGYPGEPVWSDPATGVYAIRLPEGASYRFDLTSDVPGYKPASYDVADTAVATRDLPMHADPVACTAPGYRYARQMLAEGYETSGSAPPAGWTIASNGIGWRFGTAGDISGAFFQIPEHGRFAGLNEEPDPEANDGSADYLTLPPLDLATAIDPVLRFDYYYPGAGWSTASVQGSRDGGATWIALGSIANTDFAQIWVDTVVSLAPLAGSANARVRFHSDDGGAGVNPATASALAVDDVNVSAACTAPAQGGLVVGHVRDANTGAALDGARVTIGNDAPVSTFTSADPGVGKGYFAAFAAPGTTTVVGSRGSQPAGYRDVSRTLAVTHGQTANVDLALPAGRLRAYPTGGPAATLELGTTATTTLTVQNSGTAPLAFGFEGEAVDEHFESGVWPPAGWSVANHAASPCAWGDLANTALGNYAGGEGTAAAVYLFDCYKDGRPVDTSLVTPRFDLSTGSTASVSFMLSLFDGAGAVSRLHADISVDDGNTWNTIWTLATGTPDSDPGTLVAIDLAPYIGASQARIRLRYAATPPWGWAIVDQFHVFSGLSAQRDIDLVPESGTLAPGASRELAATFDARYVTQPGTYLVRMNVAEDTPYEWRYDGSFTGTMTVTAPAHYGAFGGTVRGLGACDAAPNTLPGARVTIRNARGDAFETTTDADGNYRYWLPAADGPFTLGAQAGDHRDADAQTLALTAGAQTAANLNLRALLPCLLTDPAHLTANVAPGQNATLPFSLVNGGASGGTWTARAGGDPAQRIALPKSQTVSLEPEQYQWTGCTVSGTAAETWFIRVFPVNQLGTAEVLTVSGMAFAVGEALSQTGTQTVHARVYALRGGTDLVMANLQLLRDQPVTVADGELTRVQATFDTPLPVGPDTTLVAAVYVPNGGNAGNTFMLGHSTAGETAPDYMAAPACGLDEPTPLSDLGPAFRPLNMLIELDVIGSAPCHERATPVPWAAFSPAAGGIGGDASVSLTAQLATGSLANGPHEGTLCLGGADGEPIAVPVTLNVGNPDVIFANGFQ